MLQLYASPSLSLFLSLSFFLLSFPFLATQYLAFSFRVVIYRGGQSYTAQCAERAQHWEHEFANSLSERLGTR